MTMAEAAEARFRWLSRVAERLGCQVYVSDYGDTPWGGRGGRVPDGPRVVQVNIGEPLDRIAPAVLEAVEEALGTGTGIDPEAARWLAGTMVMLHELGHALLGHARGSEPRKLKEADADRFVWRAAAILTADITEEEAAETLERIGAEMARERAPAPAH